APEVAGLIDLGDAAVPALITCIDEDRRLTRSVHFWRDFSRDRTVLGVGEAALVAVMSILRTRVFEPKSTGDNFSAHGEEEAHAVAAKLRAYWAANAALTLPERLRRTLVDQTATFEQRRAAAQSLATLGGRRTFNTTIDLDRGV